MSEVRLIDANALKTAMMKAFNCENATKYGNKNAEQQTNSYSTLMLYEISDIVEDCIDNTQTIETYTEEDIKKAIKTGFGDGYAMAKAKFENPKPIKPTVYFPSGEKIILTDGHIQALCDYEKDQMAKEIIERFMKGFGE